MAVISTNTKELDESQVLDLLEPDQFVHARRHLLGRRKLSRSMLVLMWALRIYALFMLAVVAYQVAHAFS